MKQAAGREFSPEEIFAGAEQGNEMLQKIVNDYLHRLGTGVVNIVNIFRPQLVLFGGRIPVWNETFLSSIREKVKKNCFGGEMTELPEIEAAALGREAGMIGAASLI